MVARNLFRDRLATARPGSRPTRSCPPIRVRGIVRTWRYLCAESGARYVEVPIPLPVSTRRLRGALLGRVTPRTRVVYLSRITSPSAGGISRIRDLAAARGPGHPRHRGRRLRCADRWTWRSVGGPLHRKRVSQVAHGAQGRGLPLYARPEVQPLLEPLVVSWGWESERPGPLTLCRLARWQGTRDVSAFLAVPRRLPTRPHTTGPRCASVPCPGVEARARIGQHDRPAARLAGGRK